MPDIPASGVAGTFNFRDVGGLPAGSGVTRSGVLFRSGNLARLAPEGRVVLADLGVRRIIDLRDDAEVAGEPSALDGLSLTVERVPLFAGSVASFFAADTSLDGLYRSLIEDSSDAIVRVVRGVVADPPALVHCTVGKDRTGVTIALTLAAAGVDEEAIISDYARTEALLPADRNARIVSYLKQAHPESQNLVDLATRSPAPAMRRLLDDVRTRYGGPVEYLRSAGLASDEIAELRRVLITDDIGAAHAVAPPAVL